MLLGRTAELKETSTKNGYPIHRPHPNPPTSLSELAATLASNPTLRYQLPKDLYGAHNQQATRKFVPAFVAYDKIVLGFHAYFKQSVYESTEQYLLRRVKIQYYVEVRLESAEDASTDIIPLPNQDDSIAVVEPPVENSGIPQGILIKRQRLPKSSTEFYTVKDLNLATSVTFYGRTFRIVDCDDFTRRYMAETENITLNAPEAMPQDPHLAVRARLKGGVRGPSALSGGALGSPALLNQSSAAHNGDRLRRFLENDRKVLRFYAVWDDRATPNMEMREFIVHYYLVDDTVEVREVRKATTGRDMFPQLLRRQQLPKVLNDLVDIQLGPKFTWKDFRLGGTVSVLNREFLIRDCDEFTRNYLRENNPELTPADLEPISVPDGSTSSSTPDSPGSEWPPYNGFGTEEDSIGSCKHLVLQPPKKDFLKMLENEHKTLRFVARLDSKHVEDKDRRFVLTYRLADDTITIYEPPQRNAGILGGKFLERSRVLKSGQKLGDPADQTKYYGAADLSVGATLDIFKHKFVLMDADEFAFKWMEENRGLFPQADGDKVVGKVRAALVKAQVKKDVVEKGLREVAKEGNVARRDFLRVGRDLFKDVLTDHEIITLARKVGQEGFVNIVQLLSLF
ncbi:EF-hand domain-containing protein 1 [Gonapodya sp. JEL0774]|nr:EF-hand domain-containing protein 1 [Gonapodya sp. JEL0774]